MTLQTHVKNHWSRIDITPPPKKKKDKKTNQQQKEEPLCILWLPKLSLIHLCSNFQQKAEEEEDSFDNVPKFTLAQLQAKELPDGVNSGKKEVKKKASYKLPYLPSVPILSGSSRFTTFKTAKNRDVPIFFIFLFFILFFNVPISEKKGGNRHRPCLDLQDINFKYENCVSLAFKIAKSPWSPPRALPLDPRPLGVQILNIQMLAGMNYSRAWKLSHSTWFV